MQYLKLWKDGKTLCQVVLLLRDVYMVIAPSCTFSLACETWSLCDQWDIKISLEILLKFYKNQDFL